MTQIPKQILVAFALGAVVGMVVSRSLSRDFHHHWGDGQFQARMLQRFSAKLKLTPEQRAQVAKIFEEKRQKIEALRAEVRPKFEDIRTATSAEIRRLLSPDQQKQFDAMEAEWNARRQKFHDRWMGAGGHG